MAAALAGLRPGFSNPRGAGRLRAAAGDAGGDRWPGVGGAGRGLGSRARAGAGSAGPREPPQTGSGRAPRSRYSARRATGGGSTESPEPESGARARGVVTSLSRAQSSPARPPARSRPQLGARGRGAGIGGQRRRSRPGSPRGLRPQGRARARPVLAAGRHPSGHPLGHPHAPASVREEGSQVRRLSGAGPQSGKAEVRFQPPLDAKQLELAGKQYWGSSQDCRKGCSGPHTCAPGTCITNTKWERGKQAGERLAVAMVVRSSCRISAGRGFSLPRTSQAGIWPGSRCSGESVVRGRTSSP